MSLLSRPWYIVGAKRTPVGAFGGSLSKHTVTDLAVHSTKAAIKESDKDTAYLSRHAGLKSGVSSDVSAFTVNRLCGSGFQAVISCIQELEAYSHDIGIAGGSENMSRVPYSVRNIRSGTRIDMQYTLDDGLMDALTDHFIGYGMALTAENIATDMNISREATDEYAYYSQECWQKANSSGILSDEIASIEILDRKKKNIEFSSDEHPKFPSVDGLAKLKPVFKKDGVCTAGNSSGICDGSASIVIASAKAVEKYSLNPLAKITAYSSVGCDPTRMGLGPVPAIQMVLDSMKIDIKDINEKFDHIEINEAFASQVIGCEKKLGIDRKILNKNGGGISIGHPVGFSGARIVTHLAHQIKNKRANHVLASACIGGGQGIAIAMEKV